MILSSIRKLKFSGYKLLNSVVKFKDIKIKKRYTLYNRILTDGPINVIVLDKRKNKVILTIEETKIELLAIEDTYDDIWFLTEKTSNI